MEQMFLKVFAFCFFIALASAGVVNNRESNSDVELPGPPGFGAKHDYTYIDDDSSSGFEYLVPQTDTKVISLLKTVFHTLVAYKTTAIEIAVKAIAWIVSNVVVIALGAIATIAFCKFTDKCSLDHKYYDHVAQFRSLVTPERLASAEKFLINAVEKYATDLKKGRDLKQA